MKFSDRDTFITHPPLIPSSWMRLSSRFVGRDLTCDITTRISDDGAPLLRVYLASPRYNVRAIEVEPLVIVRSMLKGNGHAILAEVEKKTEEVMARLDYQVAAYCASDLWC